MSSSTYSSGNLTFSSPSSSQRMQPADFSAQQHGRQDPGANHNMATNFWQAQVQLAQTSRASSTPHYHARFSASMSRSSQPTGNGVWHSRTDSTDPDSTRADTGMPPGTSNTISISYGRDGKIIEQAARQDWHELDMGGQGLRNLSAALFNYQFLDKLYINHNRLTLLPGAISKLGQLSVLDISGNLISSLPAEIGLLKSLKMLLMIDNHIQTLPPEMGTLYNLEILGIEGNPIPESLKMLMSQEGTRGVIAYLRDNGPPPAPPHQRDWIVLGESASDGVNDGGLPSEEEKQKGVFTVVSYNILCDYYRGAHGYCPSWAIDWDYRKEHIKQELMTYNADIMCLQEVDGATYHDFLKPEFEDIYGGYYWPKTRVKTMSEQARKKVDGCALFYKKSVFKLLEEKYIEFNQSALKLLRENESISKFPDIYNRVSTKDNIAVIVFLQHVVTGNRVVVANVHCHWTAADRDVKLVQAGLLLGEVTDAMHDFMKRKPSDHSPAYSSIMDMPVLICGDFNSTPDSGVYQLITKGEVGGDHEDMQGYKYGRFSAEGMRHPLSLKSAYSNIGELQFTNCTPTFTEVIDYVFYSTNNLSVTGLMGEPDKEYMSKVIGLPNPHFPSDHLPLLVEMQFERRGDKDKSSET
ncbi:Endonuclease/exonuclease/phosphatase [Lipomyces oligophaga]|uniref:Endonuclease/exonuclease/phosphatase n=1 Tax=Lipomyces oligophaga TaxID=45792 RepID=UPI0034CE9B7C